MVIRSHHLCFTELHVRDALWRDGGAAGVRHGGPRRGRLRGARPRPGRARATGHRPHGMNSVRGVF